MKSLRGFTLIELLIVIAIILILIAIALPNFLEAQIRARVTKAKGELRSLGIAQESYYLDFNFYPSESEHDAHQRGRTEAGLFWLTSPIAYISTIPLDPFGRQATEDGIDYYESGGAENTDQLCRWCLETWVIYTLGPSGNTEISSDAPHWELPGDGSVDQYSPTNGTKSFGDIFLYGGESFWIGVRLPRGDMSAYRGNPSALDQPLVISGEPYLHRLPPKL